MPVRHSEYVDVVHARFLALLDGLEQMRVLGLPASVRTLLVRGAVLHVMEQLVEAYSRIQHVGDNTPLIMSSDIHVLKDSLEQLPGLNPLPFFSHVELFTKGFFLPADAPQVIIEWVYQHPFYTPQQVERLVKIVVNGGGGGGLSAMKNMFNRNQFKGQGDPQRLASRQLLAQVTLVRGICVMRVGRNLTVRLQTRVYDSASSGGRGCQDQCAAECQFVPGQACFCSMM